MKSQWSDKAYHTWNHCLRARFGEKVAKISLDAGFSCPNRDSRGRGGCIYCSPRGSGDCAGARELPIDRQFSTIVQRMQRKWPGVRKFIAYFQAYTNTHADPEYLAALYKTALAQPGVVGLSISTRPDCLPTPVMDLLDELNRKTWLWVELGLQTIHDRTLQLIRRGHDYASFLQAVDALRARNIRVCPHIILGLPGETRAMMRETANALAALPIQGLKLHMLHVVKDTELAHMWSRGEICLLDRGQYVETVVDVLERMPPDVVVQRLTGDAPREILLAPPWICRKWEVLQAIDREFSRRQTWQGRLWQSQQGGGSAE
ncbi:MAG: TIGR01212 family radical SAM protein [Firmicutes bacterium]|nr:TIGR01212 family radical SAM protein [Bacillota bacterium]